MSRRKSPTGLWVAWGLMAAVLAVTLTIGALGSAGPRTDQERVYQIADTIKCPECVGQSVADSNVEVSREIRADIARQVDEGSLSDAEIVDDILASYGDDLSQTPRASGVAGLVWVLPVVALVAAGAGLVAVFRRWSRDEPARATEQDGALVAEARVQRTGAEPRP